MKFRSLRVCLAIIVLLAAPVARGEAQMRSPQLITVGAGISKYDFYGTKGNSIVFVARFDGLIGPYVVIEPGLAFLSYKTQFGRTDYLLPEISIQGQGYVGPVRPFLGGGIGFANITHGPNMSKLTLHAVSGVRVRLGRGWGFRMEARARSVEPWQSHTLDFTAGLMRVLPSAF